MTDLRTYQLNQITTAIRVVQTYLDSPTARPKEVIEVLAQLLFRDNQESYWAADPLSERWYHWRDGEWQPAGPPNGPLEGVAILDAPDGNPSKELADDESILPPMSAAQAAATITKRLGAAYRKGHVSSDQVNDLLERVALVDHEGHVWRLGVRSGQWYAFIDGAWANQPEPPADESLLTHSDLVTWAVEGDAGEGLADERAEALGAALLLGASTLPEPVTAPWDPPRDAPPIWPACSHCDHENIPGSRFCAWCGKSVSPDEKPLCPRCASPTKTTDRFCGKCGAPLG